jgi:fructose-1,6-bisphosphatase/inositol monophosphatase family enzyme
MLIDEVSDLLRQVSAEVILPRFQQLEDCDIFEKSPGDFVTVADRQSEALISAALLKLRPGSRVVGEEACSADRGLLRNLNQGFVWLVDPIDGTANFAHGRLPFSVMIALLNDGEAVLSWMLDPVSGELCVAERGSGATINAARVFTQEADPTQLRGVILDQFMPSGVRQRVEASSSWLSSLPGMMCAGAEYPAIVKGERDFAVFWLTLPWDHAPGTLFLEEAGGVARRLNGQPYEVRSEGSGLIVARTRQTLDALLNRIEF